MLRPKYQSKIYLFFCVILFSFSFCTTSRVVRLIAFKNVYLEKVGEYCNLFYKNKQSKFILVADSVKQIIAYDSVFAYSRVILRTYPDMIIVKVDKNEKIHKQKFDWINFKKTFPSYFNFPASTTLNYAPELYDAMIRVEEKIKDDDILESPL